MDDEDQIKDKLQKLQEARQKLSEQLSQTSSILGDLETKMDGIRVNRDARMRADNRIDSRLADRLAQGNTSAIPPMPAKRNPQQKGSEEKRIQLVPDGLSEEDVTVRPGDRLTEKSLWYSELIEESRAAATLKNADGVYLYANRAAADVYEKFGGLLGTTDYQWQPQEVADRLRQLELEVMRTGETTEKLESWYHPEGKLCYWAITKFPVETLAGNIVASIALEISDLVKKGGQEAGYQRGRAQLRRMRSLTDQLLFIARRLDEPARS